MIEGTKFVKRVIRFFKRLITTFYLWLLGMLRRRPYSDDYAYQQPHMHQVPEKGIILDVASGHNPFPRATILSERFLDKNPHRTENLIRDQRPMVVLDIHHLPFKAKSIDYIYCSHVFEHIDNPELACSEFMRVAKAGYIETPTLMKDALFAWAEFIHHKWYVVNFENSLVFFEYDPRRREGVRSTQWRDNVLSKYYHPNQDLFYPNQDIFNNMFEWKDHFSVVVFRLGSETPSIRL